MKTSVIGFPRVGNIKRVKVCIGKIFQKRNRSRGAFKKKHADCEKHTGRVQKRQELITFHVMTFRFMIQCWIQPFC